MAVTWRAVALAALGLPVVLLVPATGTVLLWTLLVVVACTVDVLLAASPRQVGVRRQVPSSVRLTEPAVSTLTLSNLGTRRLRALVRDAWPPSSAAQADRHRVDVLPGDGTRVRTVLVPTRRGDAHADRVTVRTLGPLGLAGRQASLEVPGRLRVLPEFASRRHLPSRLARLRELDGRTSVQVRGPGTEFDSLREYVIGDDVRAIDWRATARRSDVVVRTWRPERDRRVLIVLDTGRTSAVRVLDAPRIDASIEAALLLAALATKAGDRVELLVYDRRVRGRVAGATGPRVMSSFADTLALAEPELVETDWPGVVAQVQQRLSQRALVVLLTALDPAAVEQGLLGVAGQLTERHQVVLASVSDPEVDALRTSRSDAAAVFDAAAAERVGLERAAVALRLRQRGAEVVDALPDQLAPRLADTYLALKAAGRL
ncbi:DUF58 domain-containing protein [Cellulomonas fengjieae]|uniref:DUF58 domain-containing protein n=1 Tax=Cellulomonas fengjieae TaxID=2819978 RepID=A0ABS3SEG3_9CELL|nr:DUF58 domain-containing protein [Cellulomonas fengjieae]MBO3083879.1 DUF58 domain-containing protein [Cellulomonas fengjieae]MBO3101369.1 DUF58 domain-containing protein [Cellulomonas fengjieae]QVI64837.1 DUF58 domain-containing protein [Cellulomonas fengjieae]